MSQRDHSMPAPALSLIQPWLSGGILRFGKRIENRTGWRACKYRGPIWLHASATSGRAFDDSAAGLRDTLYAQRRDQDWEAFRDAHLDIRIVGQAARFVPRSTVPLGAIVAHARIVDVIRNDQDFDDRLFGPDRDEAKADGLVEQRAWWFGGFALVLDEVVELKRPVPCKGALGLWRVPTHVESVARAAMPIERRETRFSNAPGGGVCQCLNDESPIICDGCEVR